MNNDGRYILDDDNNAIPCEDLHTWGKWMEDFTLRCVGFKEISNNVLVSTVFLGLDHNFGGSLPMLFETVVFGGPHNMEMRRYSTWVEAEKGHEATVNRLEKGLCPF